MIKPISKKGEELIFYNYKEPLKEVVNGYGYEGVLLSTMDGERIQCHICGNTYAELSSHTRQAHKINVREYKEKFGLAYRTALISESIRTQRKLRTIKWLNSLSLEELSSFKKTQRQRSKSYWREERRRLPQPKLTLETKNKRGTCPDQLLEKIRIVSKNIGHTPSKNEFIDYYKSQKYIHIIYKTFGSWNKAREMAGLKIAEVSTAKYKRIKPFYENDELLEYLKIFYQETGNPPTETDCRRGLIPSGSIYRNRFGTFTQARLKAGITEEVGRWIKK